jgi:hypothetical protein
MLALALPPAWATVYASLYMIDDSRPAYASARNLYTPPSARTHTLFLL